MILTGETEVLGEKHYTASVVDGRISIEHWWNNTERRNLKYWKKNHSHCHFVHHKSHIDWPGTEVASPW